MAVYKSFLSIHISLLSEAQIYKYLKNNATANSKTHLTDAAQRLELLLERRVIRNIFVSY